MELQPETITADDMLEEIYDPQRKRGDVFKYTDDAVGAITRESIGAAGGEGVQLHLDNQNNPHNVTAEQVMVTENVVNAIQETGSWSVDGILTQLGSALFGGNTLYRWLKSKEDLVLTQSNASNSQTSGEGASWRINYSSEITIDSNGIVSLVNPQSVHYWGGQGFSFTVPAGYFQVSGMTGTITDSNGIYKSNGSARVAETYSYPTYTFTVSGYDIYTYKTLSELVTDTDPNAHYDGEVDADGWTYTALDPITAFVPRIQTGSYVGTGTIGANNPCSLTFIFAPKMVTIRSDNYIRQLEWTTGMTQYGGASHPDQSSITLSGNTLTWYSKTQSVTQMNDANTTFHWVAIG